MLKLLRDEWRLLAFGFLMTFWSSPGQTFLISLFSGEIRADLGLSDGEFAAVYSLATLASAVVVIWSGTLADRIDLRKLSLWVVTGLVAGCGLISQSHSILWLLVSLFLLRQFGQGLMFIISSTAMVRYIDAHKGKATALAGMGYAVAEAVLPGLVVALLLWLGWRQSWLLLGLLVLSFMLPAIWWLLRSHGQRHLEYQSRLATGAAGSDGAFAGRQWTRGEVLRDPYFYLFLPGLLSQPLMFTGFIFHQVHMVEYKDWSLINWAALFSLYASVSVATKLVSGPMIDRFGAIPMVPLAALPMGVGLVILALADTLWWGGVFLVLTGITVGFQSTLVTPFWSEMYGNRHLGAIKSMGAAAMVFCTALSPIVIGWQIDLGVSIDTQALVAAAYIALTSAMAGYACLRRR